MANVANHAISLGLLVAVLAAVLAATLRAPAMAGAALPLLAAANGRQPARRTGTGRATARKGTGKANRTGKANGTRNGKAARAGNDKATTAAPARTPRRGQAGTSAAPAVNPVSGTQRLKPGKLQEQVLAYLADHAGEELSPSHIAKALGRSSGAVGNGLESLAKDGEVHKTRQAPRRFMIPTRGAARRNGTGTGNRNGSGQAAPKPARASRAARKAGNGPTTTGGNPGTGKGNGNGAKAEPPATPGRGSKAPASKPGERKPAARRGRPKAGAAADEAAATGT